MSFHLLKIALAGVGTRSFIFYFSAKDKKNDVYAMLRFAKMICSKGFDGYSLPVSIYVLYLNTITPYTYFYINDFLPANRMKVKTQVNLT